MPWIYLSELDCFSPRITFFYQKKIKHNSVVSGVLSILHYVIIGLVVISYFVKVLTHKNPTSFYYKKFSENYGTFEINQENFNHSISLRNINKFDPRAVTVRGFILRTNIILENQNELTEDFWVYSECNSENDSLCINYFYNQTEGKLYDKENKNFHYPLISHGNGYDGSSPYTIVVQECKNSSINENSCYSKEKITEYRKHFSSISMSFVDKYVDVERYINPFIEYENSFEFGVLTNSIKSSNIHFNPTKVKTHEGFLSSIIKEKKSFSFEQVIHGNIEVERRDLISLISFWIHNQENIYERTYIDISIILTRVTAVAEASWYCFFLLNFFVHKYIMLNDFGSLYEVTYDKVIRQNFIYHLNQEQKAQKSSFSPERINKTKSEILNFSEVKGKEFSLKKMLFNYCKIKQSIFIEYLNNLRCLILSEEKMIQYHLMLSSYEGRLSCFEHIRTRPNSVIHSGEWFETKKFSANKNNLDSSANNELIKKQNFIDTSAKKEDNY